MKKAIYAGSFDPVTLGHMDIIERAAKLFDVLVVAVLENPNKKSLFTVEERKHHLELATKHIENVEVASFQGLFVDFAKEIGADVAVRGLRNTLDFSAEYPMYLINRKLGKGLETVYLAADEEHLPHLFRQCHLAEDILNFHGFRVRLWKNFLRRRWRFLCFT